ncbi:MAG: hypothetical protein GC155_04470 [Alphaproteobacteria bacterium]|nr:hypothetical protein [Alphaproteobacteria bacterium]
MSFRPLPVLTLLTIPMLAALIWLGVWQIQRAQWKAGLIADYEKMSASTPEPLDEVLCSAKSSADGMIGRPVAGADVRSDMLSKALPGFIRMFGQNAAGDSGWLLLAAAPAPQCLGEPVLIEAGFETLNHVQTIYAEQPHAPARYLVEPWPHRNMFAPANAPDVNDWHWFDGPAIAAHLGAPALNDEIYLSVVAGLPDELTSVPPSRHIGYAVTWFGMAIALLVIYGIFHVRAGRLAFGKRDSEST